MKAAIFQGKGVIGLAERPDPTIKEPTDAVVRVVLACVCGSDLWYYRGQTDYPVGSPIGHEFLGVVEHVGNEVRHVAKGDFVISPFAYSDGTCPNCQAGITTACLHGGFIPAGNGDGGQGEFVRVPLADGTLVKVPGSHYSDEIMKSLLTLSDVMGTGHHAAVSAEVQSLPLLTDLANKYGKTPAQIVLRWHIQLGLVVIPKSSHPKRIQENRNIFDFELSQEELAAISALDTGVRLDPDPDVFAGE